MQSMSLMQAIPISTSYLNYSVVTVEQRIHKNRLKTKSTLVNQKCGEWNAY